jgi:hypothetical protein
MSKKTENTKPVTIEKAVVVVRLSDKTIRQVVLNEEDENWILNLIYERKGKIPVMETALYGITLEPSH